MKPTLTRNVVGGSAVLLAALAACGNVKSPAAGDAGIADAWQSSCVPTQLITTIESNHPAFDNQCLHGSWSLEAFNGTTMPVVAGQPNSTAPVIPAAITIGTDPLDPASTYAVHVTGSGQENTATASAFAQLTVSLNTLSAAEIGTVDASAYTGIQFYAIINTAATGARLTVANEYTHPSGGICAPDGATRCFDSPGLTLDPSKVWTRYQVPFANLVQLGFGNKSPLGADFPKTKLINLKWDLGIPQTGPTGAWELWVDDVTFY